MENFAILYENLLKFQWQDIVMILLGCLLIFLAIKKEMEPSLLLARGSRPHPEETPFWYRSST